MKSLFHREITPLQENDCFIILDRRIKGFTFPVHFHPEFEINFISKGSGASRIVGDHMGEVVGLELVMTGPNLCHGWENYHNDVDHTIHMITIQFSRELFHEILINKNLMLPIRELLDNAKRGILFSQKTASFLEAQLIELSNKSGFDSFLEFQSLLYNLAISRDQTLLTNVAFQQKGDFHNSERIEKLYNYIQENYQTKIKVEDAANLLNMSVVSFSRLIKQRIGRSFIDFVNEIRLGYAIRSLIETNKGITEICYECGFSNISNFNRIFRKKQHCTPSDFREHYLGTKKVL